MFSPSAPKSTTPRSARPMRRWISTVRPSGRPFADVALLALARRRREHPVLRGDPAAALAGHPARHALLRRGGADHARLAHGDQRRAGRRAHEPRLDRRPAAARRGAPSVASARGSRHGLRRAGRRARPGRAASAGSACPARGTSPCRPCTGSGTRPPRAARPAASVRGLASAASRARARPGGRAPAPEVTIRTSRPSMRCSIGRTSG